jgi:2-polyprenyl-3-methyl-5-hydroxy-6-metoxy-1,4-benzoquinol methylase
MINIIEENLVTLPCDLCGSYNEKMLYTKKGVLTGYPFKIVKCKSCGFIYINPKLNEEGINSLYNEDYYSGKGFDSYVDYIDDYYNDRESGFHLSILNEIRNYVQPPSKLLDFGCGLGNFLRLTLKAGYESVGYDVSEFATNLGRKNGLNILNNKNELPQNYYDIVIAIEVIEHAISPTETIYTIYDTLKKGGLFYYTTWNAFFFDLFAYFGIIKDNSYICPEGHINFFTKVTVQSPFLDEAFFLKK